MKEKMKEYSQNPIHQKVPNCALYINGQFVASKTQKTFRNYNPFTNKVINEIAEGREEDIILAVGAAKKAFTNGPWKTMKLEKRMEYIEKIADLIDKEVNEIAFLESIDTGLPISQTRNMVARAAQNFRFYSKMVQANFKGDAYVVNQEFLNYTLYKPIGVVGLITPWNAPFMLLTWKVAPALASGNTVVLKPAELSPLSAHKLAEIIHVAGLPEGVFNVVHGFGETAGASLVKNKDVAGISFTGETTTGISIMKNAADSFKKTSMELGGKSPLIVFDDADIERAVDASIWGVFSFNGERCTANSRLLLQKSIYPNFVAQLKDRVQKIKVGDPLHVDTELGPLISKEHYSRVMGYIELALKEGCEVIQGKVPENFHKGNYVPPTLLLNASNNMAVCQEEIFGPVMAVMTFNDEEEAISLANDNPYGLAGYIWTNDIKRAHRVANEVEAGMLWLNSQNVRDLRIPFGGMKHSGVGREGGHYAIYEFYTEPKVIHVALGEHHIPQFGK